MHEEDGLAIWFFVGVMLTIYGIIVLIASIPAFISTIESPHVVLARLHAGLWWGILLTLLGVLFLYLHWPGKHSVLDDKDNDVLSDNVEGKN